MSFLGSKPRKFEKNPPCFGKSLQKVTKKTIREKHRSKKVISRRQVVKRLTKHWMSRQGKGENEDEQDRNRDEGGDKKETNRKTSGEKANATHLIEAIDVCMKMYEGDNCFNRGCEKAAQRPKRLARKNARPVT